MKVPVKEAPARESGEVKTVTRRPRDTRAAVAGLADVIRGARQGRYSLDELAGKSGVSAGLISQIERGLGNPSVVTLTKLAYALDLSIGSVFPPPHPGWAPVLRGGHRSHELGPRAR